MSNKIIIFFVALLIILIMLLAYYQDGSAIAISKQLGESQEGVLFAPRTDKSSCQVKFGSCTTSIYADSDI